MTGNSERRDGMADLELPHRGDVGDPLEGMGVEASSPRPGRDDESRAAWSIRSTGEAVWAHRQLADAREREAEIRAIAAAEADRWQAKIDACREWADLRCAADVLDIGFFTRHLEAYALATRAATGGDRKTITTPYGTVTTRVGRPKWVVADGEAAMAWVKANHPELIMETVPPSSLPAVLDVEDGDIIDARTGEVVDFMTYTPAAITATVKTTVP